MRCAAKDLSRLVGRFKGQVQDLRVGLEDRLRGGEELRRLLKSMTDDLTVLVRQMEGAAQRLSLQDALGLSSSEWEGWTAPEGSRLLTCVVAREEAAEVDLLDVARREPA